MKRILAAALAASVLSACATTQKAAAAPAPAAAEATPAWCDLPPALNVHPDALKIGVLDFTPRQPEIFKLGNGLTVYHLEDRTVPLVTASLLVKAGEIYEPAAQAGVAGLTAEAMRAGGAGKLDPDALDAKLAMLAASLELGASDESTGAGLSVRAQDVEQGFALFADVIEHPRFDPARVQVVKLSAQGEIERRKDEPGGEAWRAFKKAVYGPESPWAREMTRTTLAKVDAAALRAWHARYFHPNVASLVITGDLDTAEAHRLAETYFGPKAWPQHDVTYPEVVPVKRDLSRKVILVPREIPQAKVRIGHLGFTRHDPQEYAIRLADSVLGGAMFVSRLAREIRSNLGLAYSISSSTTPGRDVGLFAVAADTKSESVSHLVQTSLDIVKTMSTEPAVSPVELSRAKDLFVNQFAFRFDTARKAALERATFDFYGYGPTYLPEFPHHIAGVTAPEIDAAARRVFGSGESVIVVVGDPKKIGDLSALGPVQVIHDVDAWK